MKAITFGFALMALAVSGAEFEPALKGEVSITGPTTVRVDRRIDEFLKKRFNRYDYYCGTKAEDDGDGAYLHYAALREDEQLDDLTLVAAKII